MLTALIQARVKRRQVPLSALPSRMVEAVLAIEDRRYYSHPGVDPIRMVGALFTEHLRQSAVPRRRQHHHAAAGEKLLPHRRDGVEQQTRQRGVRRKLLEQFMAVILDIRATKDEVLELYLNDVYLGNRGSFAIHGVAEAARLYFGKDVNNLSLGEAATIAGIIQSPGTLSPFNSPSARASAATSCCARWPTPASSRRTPPTAPSKEPLAPVARALDAEAPYFVDFVGQALAEQFPAVTQTTTAVDVYTTLDLHLQRLAQDAVSSGIAKVDQLLSRRKRGRVPQAALIAVDPRTGDILAMVGGRLVQPVAVQPRGQRQPAARLGLQAVRLSRGVRARRRRRHAADARDARQRRTDDVRCERDAVEPGQLRERIRRRDHAAARAGDVAQRRDRQGGRSGRLRSRRRSLAAHRRRHDAARVSVDRARRVRSDAARHRDARTRSFTNGGETRTPAAAAAHQARRRGDRRRRSRRRTGSRAPTRPIW